MSFLRRLLRRQDGITLVMAVGILGVLTMSGATVVYFSNTNARTAEHSTAYTSSYHLAEAGINEMMAILSRPENNALNKYLLGYQADGSVTHTVHEYDLGTVVVQYEANQPLQRAWLQLDGGADQEDMVLSGLPNGAHEVVLYAMSEDGRTESASAVFTSIGFFFAFMIFGSDA